MTRQQRRWAADASGIILAAWRLCHGCEVAFRSAKRAVVPLAAGAIDLDMDDIFVFADRHAQRFEDELCELLRIASVSADSQFHGEVRRAAQWVGDYCRQMGLATELIETIGHPLIVAETPDV